jgi:uncharacterized membrane protein
VVTHLVVEDADEVQRLVPIDLVAIIDHDNIQLRCTQAELAAMEQFVTTRYVPTEHVEYDYAYALPYLTARESEAYYEVETEHVPPDEVAVHRGMQVEADDGHVGTVSGLLLHPKTAHVTHVIVQTSRRFHGKEEVTIPLSAIERVFDQTVYLNISRSTIAALPAIPVKHRHFEKLSDPRKIEIVARIFDDPEKASENLEFVQKLHRGNVITLLNAATVVKDEDGKLHVKETKDMDARKGRRFGAIAGVVVSLLAGPGGLIVGALAGAITGGLAADKIDRGFSDDFLKAFETQLEPGNSALVVLVEHEHLYPLSEAMSDREGIVIQETLSDTLIEELERQAKSG